MKNKCMPFLIGVQLGLITLKLCGVINWAWHWVLTPTIGYLAFAAFLFIGFIIYFATIYFKYRRK